MVVAAAGAGSIGEIRWCNIVNGLENRAAAGKVRPALVIDESPGHVVAIGFTTQPTTRDGTDRPAIPNPGAIGLSRPGYLWSRRPARVGRLDLGGHIGWADADLIELVLSRTEMWLPQRLVLRRYQAGLGYVR